MQWKLKTIEVVSQRPFQVTLRGSSRLGFELFYWAYGKGQKYSKDFLDEKVKFPLDKKVKVNSDIKRLKYA